jgi:hypothetical protein
MNAERLAARSCIVFVVCCAAAFGQAKVHSKPLEEQPRSIPVFDVKLTPDTDLSVPYDDRTGTLTNGCDSHGAPYVRMIQLLPKDISVLRLGPKETVTFSATKITDVSEPNVIDTFALGSTFNMLVEGGTHKQQVVKQLEDGSQETYFETKGQPEPYIARFGEDGSYKSSVKLDLPFRPQRLSGFESGSFVVAGFDDRKIYRVALVDSSGSFLRYVEFSKESDESAEKKLQSSLGVTTNDPDTAAGLLAELTGFFPRQTGILYVRGHSASPIYEIRETGEVKLIKIKVPKGSSVERIVPSDKNLIVESEIMGRLPSAEASELYEVDPATGEPVRKYRVEQYARFSEADQLVACMHEGEFRAIRHENGKLTLLHGVPEPAAVKAGSTGSKP